MTKSSSVTEQHTVMQTNIAAEYTVAPDLAPPPSYSDPFCFWSSPPLPVVFSGKLSWGVRMLLGQAVMTHWYPNSSESPSWMEGLLNLVLYHNTYCWRMFSNLRYFKTRENTKGTEQLLAWLMLSLFFGLQSGASRLMTDCNFCGGRGLARLDHKRL